MHKITFKKIAAVILLAALNVGILNIPATNAFYNDEEKSNANIFAAGALDFVLSDGGFSPISAALNFEPGTTTSKTIGMALEGESNPIKYTASAKNTSGDVSFCDAINLSANLNNENQFSGGLTSFVSPATTTVGDWKYGFSMPADSHFYNSVCSFDFEYEGRQTSPHNEYTDGGYYDIEKASSTIYSWGFRINKVYYDVKTTNATSTNRGVEGDNEWVEIYNQTDTSLDINGWQICDNSNCDTLSSTSPIMIPAKGFAVITAKSTTWKYWELADNVVPIVLNQNIGGGLHNDEDMLILKRSPDGMIVDQMNWGTANPTWTNFNSDVWDLGATDVPDGHTLARKPNGYDTNQASDFVDLAPPVVNLINPDQSGTLAWYWTYIYDILWSASNPNGSNDDLKIDLSYIMDRDYTETITSGDETVVIAKNLPNTGSYTWTVPSGFRGYIWVKIAAFGPENPMLNSQMTSAKIWDPYPLEMILTDPLAVLESILDSMNATSTAEIVPEAESATTTIEIIPTGQDTEITPVAETASTTEEIMPEITPSTETASTTEEIAPIMETATTTEEVMPIATTTEEIIIPEISEAPSPSQGEGVGDGVVPEPETVLIPSPDQGEGEGGVLEPVVEPEPVVQSEPVIVPPEPEIVEAVIE